LNNHAECEHKPLFPIPINLRVDGRAARRPNVDATEGRRQSPSVGPRVDSPLWQSTR